MAALAIGAGMQLAGMLGGLFGGSSAGKLALNAANQAQQQSGVYGAQAANSYGALFPQLTRLASNPYGLSPATYAQIQSGELQSAAGQAGSEEERARLAAQRSGNAAAAGALGAAGAEAAARGAGSNLLRLGELQAKTQAQQQAEGLRGLQGLYGQAIRGQAANASLIPRDVGAAIAGGNGGWLNNMLKMSAAMKNNADAATGLAKLFGAGGGGGGGSLPPMGPTTFSMTPLNFPGAMGPGT